MRLSTRITIAMIALVLFTAAAIGSLVYRDLDAALPPRALERLATHTTLRATELASYMHGARSDVLGFRSAAAVDGIVRAYFNGGRHPDDGTSLDAWRERLAKRFMGELESKPAYMQFRVIAADDGGRELVRVDRPSTGGRIFVVPDDELQRKGDMDYFRHTIALPPGEVYLSGIDLNREWGVIETPRVPVLRVATPLPAPDGRPFGILIINLDMRPAFHRIRSAVQSGGHIYVVNERGDFLVHPDRSREFAFEFGRAERVQDEFPGFAATLAGDAPQARMLDNAAGASYAVASAPAKIADATRASVIETLPHAVIMQPVIAARHSIVLAATAAIVVAIGLAVWLSQSMARPLVQMTGAVQAFTQDGRLAVPTHASGEVGVLARAFARMSGEVRAKTAALEREIAERRRMFETSIDLILVVDRKGNFLRVSPSSQAILGYEPHEMIGHNAIEFIYPDDLESTRNEMRMARHGRHIRNFETRYRHKDDHIVTLAWTGVWSQPEEQHFFIGRDMSEQRLAQEMFRLAVESCPSGMVMFDGDNRIVLVNNEMERLFAYTRDELIGQPISLLLPNGMLVRAPGDAVRPGPASGEFARDPTGVRKDGSRFPVEIRLNPIQIRDAALVLGVIVDISERRRNDRLKDEFVSTVSHELRTPLTSIAGSLGLLSGGAAGQMSEPTMRLLRIAHKNSERLVRLINDILDIEKIESGKIVFDLKRVEVCALIEQAIEANRGFAEGFGVRALIAAEAAPVFVRADPDRLVQVVTNLLSNAVKFSPRGGDVTVGIEPGEHSVRILVRDHGPGIPEEFKARIFEKFAQADATDTRGKGGTGLGLSIVKQIVLMLGGTVHFDTPAGGGTIFCVDLPRWEIAEGAEAGASEAQVLICDDDAAVARAIAERLASAGLRADLAPSGREALALAREKAYDAILVDLLLPDCDGISLIQVLRSSPKHQNTPIVVLSADPARGRDDIRSASLDVLDWLNKPVDVQQLVEVLGRPLARGAGRQPQVLHIDDDASVLKAVAGALGGDCAVTSVASIAQARQAVAARRFDLAVVDLVLSQASGLDLLPDLRNPEGAAIPVILYSARAANGANSARLQAALTKSHQSIDQLIATLRKHLAGPHAPAPREKDVA